MPLSVISVLISTSHWSGEKVMTAPSTVTVHPSTISGAASATNLSVICSFPEYANSSVRVTVSSVKEKLRSILQ